MQFSVFKSPNLFENLQNTEVKMKSSVLEPCENPTFNFPPLPRRPLRSQTYFTFVQILSHCAALQSPQLPPKQGETSVQNVSGGCHLVPCDSVALQEPPAGFLNGDIHKMPSDVSCLDPMDAEVERNCKERDVNCVSPVDSGEENNAHIMSVCHVVDEKKSSCTAVGHEGIIEQKLDMLPTLHDYEVPGDFCFHTDTVLNVSAPPQQTDDTSLKDERDLSMELRMKEKEFEELICSPTAGDSSDCLAAADAIEEGEVSGDESPYETMDFLFDSAEAQEGLGSENQSGAIGLSEIDMNGFFSLEEVHNSNDLLETQSTITHLDADKVPFSCEGRVQINEVHKSDSAIDIGQILEKVVEVKSNLTAVAEDLAPHRIIIAKNTTDDRDVLTDEKDVCVAKNEMIKKRGPLSKERKAKKKQKERNKRAEKNMKLGVKRLKLQPVVKAIKVTDCRHYMNGRCQMGEKCKFSHEKTPLTKSKPCRHFACHSCMKGDDCPYDHQLSKYPCEKYANDNRCPRGAGCKFSHEISVTGCALTSSNICKADLKSPVQNSDLNPKQHMNLHGRTHQQFDSTSKSLEKSTSRSSEKTLVPDPQKPVAVPKGISMIYFGGSSSSSKHDKSPMPVVEESVVNLDQQATINSLNRVQKSNEEVANKVPLRPKGINFPSFGKTPLSASQFDGHHDVGESLFGGLNRSSIFDLPSSGNNKTPDDSNQSSLNVVTSKNGTENMISDACTPHGSKFLSLGEDNISAVVGVEQSGSRPNNVNYALPCTQGRENSFGGPKSSIDMPQGSSCSSNPFSLCSAGTSFSIKESLSSNVPKSALKALNSTLAFAAKFDSKIKLGPCISHVSSKMTVQDGSNFANVRKVGITNTMLLVQTTSS